MNVIGFQRFSVYPDPSPGVILIFIPFIMIYFISLALKLGQSIWIHFPKWLFLYSFSYTDDAHLLALTSKNLQNDFTKIQCWIKTWRIKANEATYFMTTWLSLRIQNPTTNSSKVVPLGGTKLCHSIWNKKVDINSLGDHSWSRNMKPEIGYSWPSQYCEF